MPDAPTTSSTHRALPLADAPAASLGERSAIPLVHAAVAIAWLLVAGQLLSAAAGDLAAARWGAPRVVAATHALTLGWLLTIAVGVLHQIAPAAMGVAPRSTRLWIALLPLLSLGAAGVVLGAWQGGGRWSQFGWAVVLVSVLGYAWVLLGPDRATPAGRGVARRVAMAFAALLAGMLLAALRLRWTGSPDLTALRTGHIALGLGGFGTLLSIGVGLHLLPGFFGARHVSVRTGHAAFRLVATGVGATALAAMAATDAAWWWEPLRRSGVALAGLGAVCFGVQVAQWTWARRNARLDPTQGGVILAASALSAAGVIAIVGALRGQAAAPILTAWGTLMLPGWLVLFVASVLVRIIPLQAWMERFSTAGAGSDRPRVRVADLALPGVARAVVLSLATGVLAIVAGAGLHSVPLARSGALSVVAVGLLLASYLAHALWRHRAPRGAL